MRNVYVVSDNILSPLGADTRSNMEALMNGRSGIQQQVSGISPEPFLLPCFHLLKKPAAKHLRAFEQIVFDSARDAIQKSPVILEPEDKKTGFILSSTKGNIGLIENLNGENIPVERISLNTSARLIAGKLGFVQDPLVVSHACISGLLAMITGMRLIRSGLYDELIVSGADLISSFIFSGFLSFQAISPEPCKPFDAARDGITFGEAAATVILSSTQ